MKWKNVIIVLLMCIVTCGCEEPTGEHGLPLETENTTAISEGVAEKYPSENPTGVLDQLETTDVLTPTSMPEDQNAKETEPVYTAETKPSNMEATAPVVETRPSQPEDSNTVPLSEDETPPDRS